MMRRREFLIPYTLVVFSFFTVCIEAHGRLLEPPSRASMWRYGYETPKNYLDNQMYCGGFSNQWDINGGKCGVCGDPWQGPRDHEAGGKYATGLVTRRFHEGAVISVVVQLTASHRGYFQFSLCPVNNPLRPATPECFDKYHLQLADGSGSRYYVTIDGAYNHGVQLKLPEGLECSQCVLQWKYNAGNSWGVDDDGRGCPGCGRQEQFYGCSDISIGDMIEFEHYIPIPTSTTPKPTETSPTEKLLTNTVDKSTYVNVSQGGWSSGFDSEFGKEQNPMVDAQVPPNVQSHQENVNDFQQLIIKNPLIEQNQYDYPEILQSDFDYIEDIMQQEQTESLDENDSKSYDYEDFDNNPSNYDYEDLFKAILGIFDDASSGVTDPPVELITKPILPRYHRITTPNNKPQMDSSIQSRVQVHDFQNSQVENHKKANQDDLVDQKTSLNCSDSSCTIDARKVNSQEESVTEGLTTDTNNCTSTELNNCQNNYVPKKPISLLDMLKMSAKSTTARPSNSWGTSDGKSCVGCGPQEQFYACADIAIGSSTSRDATQPPGTNTTSIATLCSSAGLRLHSITVGSFVLIVMILLNVLC